MTRPVLLPSYALILRVNNPTKIEQVFSRITQSGVDAVFVINHPMFGRAAKQLAEANRLPLFSPYRETAESGALIAWAQPRLPENHGGQCGPSVPGSRLNADHPNRGSFLHADSHATIPNRLPQSLDP